jgi:hypothetical protein
MPQAPARTSRCRRCCDVHEVGFHGKYQRMFHIHMDSIIAQALRLPAVWQQREELQALLQVEALVHAPSLQRPCQRPMALSLRSGTRKRAKAHQNTLSKVVQTHIGNVCLCYSFPG